MKKTAIVHGTDGSFAESWFLWLKTRLGYSGYEATALKLVRILNEQNLVG